MSDLTLEQEFEMIKQQHMLNTCITALENELEQQIDNSTGINIPSFLLKDQIKHEVADRIRKALRTGTFETLYTESWEKAKGILAP